MAKIGKYKVPFDAKGNLLHYAYAQNIDWRDNDPFEAQLQLAGMTSGYSAKYLTWIDTLSGERYSMFIADLMDVIDNSTLEKGLTLRTKWVVRKRGKNYGIALYTAD